MSIPISYCEIVKAVDTGDYRQLKKAMQYNSRCGGYTIFSCNHKKPCRQLSKEEWDLANRVCACKSGMNE